MNVKTDKLFDEFLLKLMSINPETVPSPVKENNEEDLKVLGVIKDRGIKRLYGLISQLGSELAESTKSDPGKIAKITLFKQTAEKLLSDFLKAAFPEVEGVPKDWSVYVRKGWTLVSVKKGSRKKAKENPIYLNLN